MGTKMRTHMTGVLVLAGLLAASVGVVAAEARTITAAEAIELAVENDSGLRLSKLNLTIAELRLEAAQTALVLPSVSLSVSPPELTSSGLGSHLTASVGASLPLPWGQGSLTADIGLDYDIAAASLATPTWQISLSDLFDLMNPGGGLSSLESSERAAASAERALGEAERGLVLSTLETYQGLLSQAKQAEQGAQSVDRLEAELTQVQSLAADGYKGDQDLSEARLLLLDAQVQAEKSAASYATALEAFSRETLGLSETCSLEPLSLSMTDLLPTAKGLLLAEVSENAVENAESVRSARQDVDDAEGNLSEARGGALPSLTLSGRLDATEWKIGVGLSFDLFSASRSTDVRIAEANVALAQERLDSARESTRNRILSLKAALLSAVRNGESLALETEKWQLKEELTAVRHDVGSLSDSDWAAFLEEKDSFAVDAVGRATSLLIAYLTYRNVLGLALDWEEWLR